MRRRALLAEHRQLSVRVAINRGETFCRRLRLSSPVKSSLGGTGRWKRYRALPWPPLDLPASNLRRLVQRNRRQNVSPRIAPPAER